VLRRIEQNLESLVEGVFGRAFRSPVQPVELARKLAKEMDENKAVSVSRVYAPNEYILYLSPRDRAQYRQYEDALLLELSTYLMEHAQAQGYALLSRPRILVEDDDDLRVGLFGISTRMVEPKRNQRPQVPPEAPAAYDSVPVEESGSAANGPSGPSVNPDAAPTITIGGSRRKLVEPVVVLGRSEQCDIVVDDASASRRHAEIRRDGARYVLVDLESTNGVYVNGERTDHAVLSHGDVVSIGRSQLHFEC